MHDIQLQKAKVSYDPKSGTAQVLIGESNIKLHFQAEDPSKCLWHFLFETWAAEGAKTSAIVEKTGEE